MWCTTVIATLCSGKQTGVMQAQGQPGLHSKTVRKPKEGLEDVIAGEGSCCTDLTVSSDLGPWWRRKLTSESWPHTNKSLGGPVTLYTHAYMSMHMCARTHAQAYTHAYCLLRQGLLPSLEFVSISLHHHAQLNGHFVSFFFF